MIARKKWHVCQASRRDEVQETQDEKQLSIIICMSMIQMRKEKRGKKFKDLMCLVQFFMKCY